MIHNDSTYRLPGPQHQGIMLGTIDDAPLDSATVAATTTVHDVWSNGIAPASRRDDTQPYSGAVALLIALMALIAFAAPQLRRILSSLDTDLLGVRRRANAFDSHTAAESRTLGLLLFLGCSCQAILLSVAIDPTTVSNGPLLGAMALLAICYYIFQYTAYSIVGYTFTDGINAAQWRQGFNLSQGVLGLCLALPAITILYYHKATDILLIVALILYFIARIAFICKCFRIFYNGLPSLVYFILYLCALEIVPVILVVATARQLVSLI